MRPEEGERPAVELFDDFPWEPERRHDRTPLLPAADVFATFEWRDEAAEGADAAAGGDGGDEAGGGRPRSARPR